MCILKEFNKVNQSSWLRWLENRRFKEIRIRLEGCFQGHNPKGGLDTHRHYSKVSAKSCCNTMVRSESQNKPRPQYQVLRQLLGKCLDLSRGSSAQNYDLSHFVAKQISHSVSVFCCFNWVRLRHLMPLLFNFSIRKIDSLNRFRIKSLTHCQSLVLQPSNEITLVF